MKENLKAVTKQRKTSILSIENKFLDILIFIMNFEITICN